MLASKHKPSWLAWPCLVSATFLEAQSRHGRRSGILLSTHFGIHFGVSFLFGFEFWPPRSLCLLCTTDPLQPDSPTNPPPEYKGSIIFLYYSKGWRELLPRQTTQPFLLNHFCTVPGTSSRAFLLQSAFLRMDSANLSHVSVMFPNRNLIVGSGQKCKTPKLKNLTF